MSADLFGAAPPSSAAAFSPCRTWRYRLERVWDPVLPRAAFILLNPSTADETLDDPTIRRCIGFAKSWGMGGLVLGNAFALRSTDPYALQTHQDPVGPENNAHLAAIAAEAPDGVVVCGWGFHARLGQRGRAVIELLERAGARPHTLKLTKWGEPGHPLYLRKDLEPMPYQLPPIGRTR